MASYSENVASLYASQCQLLATPSWHCVKLWGKAMFTLSHDGQGLTMAPEALCILQQFSMTQDYIHGRCKTASEVRQLMFGM